MKRRNLKTVIIAALMIFSLVNGLVFAGDGGGPDFSKEEYRCGKWGKNLHYSFCPETGVLRIGGEGEMDALTAPTEIAEDGTGYDKELRDALARVTEEVVIEEGVRSIGGWIFKDFHKMKRISLPESLEKIQDGIFNHCYSLKIFKVPAGIKVFGEECDWVGLADQQFDDCLSIEKVDFSENHNIKRIGKGTFADCINLREVIFPDSLEEIDFSKTTDEYTLGGPEGYSRGAFHGCVSLEKVEFPEGLKKIGRKAFMGCSSLEKVVLPESVEEIGKNAFNDPGIKHIYFEGDAPEIEEKAFDRNVTIHYDPARKGWTGERWKGYRAVYDGGKAGGAEKENGAAMGKTGSGDAEGGAEKEAENGAAEGGTGGENPPAPPENEDEGETTGAENRIDTDIDKDEEQSETGGDENSYSDSEDGEAGTTEKDGDGEKKKKGGDDNGEKKDGTGGEENHNPDFFQVITCRNTGGEIRSFLFFI